MMQYILTKKQYFILNNADRLDDWLSCIYVYMKRNNEFGIHWKKYLDIWKNSTSVMPGEP